MLRHHRAVHGAAVVFAMVFPTVVTLAYFVLLAGSPAGLQQAVYLVGKTISSASPLWPWRSTLRGGRGTSPEDGGHLSLGTFCGCNCDGSDCGFSSWSVPAPDGSGARALSGPGRRVWPAGARRHGRTVRSASGRTAKRLPGAGQAVRDKIVDLGIDRLWMYAAVGVFYAICHSGLEEYYWRWFVFGQLRLRLRSAPADRDRQFGVHGAPRHLVGDLFWLGVALDLRLLAGRRRGRSGVGVVVRAERVAHRPVAEPPGRRRRDLPGRLRLGPRSVRLIDSRTVEVGKAGAADSRSGRELATSR